MVEEWRSSRNDLKRVEPTVRFKSRELKSLTNISEKDAFLIFQRFDTSADGKVELAELIDYAEYCRSRQQRSGTGDGSSRCWA